MLGTETAASGLASLMAFQHGLNLELVFKPSAPIVVSSPFKRASEYPIVWNELDGTVPMSYTAPPE